MQITKESTQRKMQYKNNLTKCAEVHYRNGNFCILCIFCEARILSYPEFLHHFHGTHYNKIQNINNGTELPVRTKQQNIEPGLRNSQCSDPLELCQKGVYKDELKCVQIECQLNTEIGNIINSEIGESEANSSDFPFGESDQKSNHTKNNASDQRCEIFEKKSDEQIVYANNPFLPNTLRIREKRLYKPRNKPNLCSYCGRTFRRRYQLDTHLNIHTGSKPHQCDICGKLFRAITTLTRHLLTHEKRDSYHCKFCRKSFTHKVAALSHELRHTQERRVPCDECGKLFYTQNQMDTHKRKVHHKSDESLPFSCNICPKQYRSASMLSTHKSKKHFETSNYFCDRCEKRFINKNQLETHMILHINSIKYT